MKFKNKKILSFLYDVENHPTRFGKQVHHAVARFHGDLARSEAGDFPYVFREELGEKVVTFIEILRQSKGVHARRNLILEPWQVFALMNIYGWVDRETGLRRFRVVYLSVGRKNGKSTLLTGIGLQHLLIEKESSGEIYLTANKLDQAGIIFQQAVETIRLTPGLTKHCDIKTYTIQNPKTFSTLKKLASDSTTLDGLNPSVAVMDEVHAMRNDKLYNVLLGGMGARSQPLLVMITTAGNSRDGFGFEQETYCNSVLKGDHTDEEFFGLVFSVDEEDEPGDEKTWIKANPNLGVSVSMASLRQQYNQAKLSPLKLSDFINKRLNRYTSTRSGWISDEAFKAITVPEPEGLEGEPCIISLDLSKRYDFTAVSYTYPRKNHFTRWKFYLPEEGFMARVEFENQNYQKWVNQGWITLTPGPVVDFEIVREDIKAEAEKLDVVSVLYDPYMSRQLIPGLKEDGLPCTEHPQSIKFMAPPTVELERAIITREIQIENNPVLLWMAQNVEVWRDANDNPKIQKGDDKRRRIDGVICLIMGYGKSRTWTGAKPSEVNIFWV